MQGEILLFLTRNVAHWEKKGTKHKLTKESNKTTYKNESKERKVVINSEIII